MLKKEDVNINDLVDEAIEVIAPLAPDKHIRRTGSIQNPIWADRYQIIQVLINFINNAIRYGPQSYEIIIHLSEDDNQVTVGIQDFGVGISPQYQRKIFERFYRVAKKNDTNFTGLGVGLYISSEIIKSHKGKVWVDSAVGRGSTFYFSLPKKTKRKRKKKTV
jgi:signal transduction histidine kinase